MARHATRLVQKIPEKVIKSIYKPRFETLNPKPMMSAFLSIPEHVSLDSCINYTEAKAKDSTDQALHNLNFQLCLKDLVQIGEDSTSCRLLWLLQEFDKDKLWGKKILLDLDFAQD